MQRTEALSIHRLKALPGSRQGLYQAVQSSNPELVGWADLELEAPAPVAVSATRWRVRP